MHNRTLKGATFNSSVYDTRHGDTRGTLSEQRHCWLGWFRIMYGVVLIICSGSETIVGVDLVHVSNRHPVMGVENDPKRCKRVKARTVRA